MWITLVTWALSLIVGKTRGQAAAPKVSQALPYLLIAASAASAFYHIGYNRAEHIYKQALDGCYGDWEEERHKWNDHIEDIGKQAESETAASKKSLTETEARLKAAIEAYTKAAEYAGNKPQTLNQESVNKSTCTGGLTLGAVRTLRGAMP